MPHYFFHSANGVRTIDGEGTDLSSIDAAQLEAIAFLAETLRHEPHELRATGELHVDVTDSENHPLFTLTAKLEVNKGYLEFSAN